MFVSTRVLNKTFDAAFLSTKWKEKHVLQHRDLVPTGFVGLSEG